MGLPKAPPRLSLVRKLVLAGEIVAAYLRARALLSRRDVVEALAELRRPAGRPVEVPDDFEVARLARAVVRTLRVLPTDSRCLMRSLVLTSLLARRGLATNVVIGVSFDDGFAAHAWVEEQGQPLLPPGVSYSRLVEL